MTLPNSSQRFSGFLFGATLFCAAALPAAIPASAQTPLDLRVMNERLNQIEQQLQSVQGAGGAGTRLQMPSVPSQTGMTNQPLPTDVAGRLQVRVQQLERLVEVLTGQVEETRFEVSRMRAELQQMSSDVSYRLAVLEQATGVSSAVAAPPPGPPSGQQMASPAMASPMGTTSGMTMQPQGQPQGQTPQPALAANGRVEPDLSRPMSAPVQAQPQMGVPESTQVQIAPGAELTAPANAGPVNQGNTFGVLRTDESGAVLPPSANPSPAMTLPPAQPAQVAPPVMQAAPSPGPVASARIGAAAGAVMELTALPPGTPKEQYDYAFGILRQADYARAEKALRLFLEDHSADDLAGNAQYWLGETFYVRGDFEQAAVEFLSGYQTYPSSSKAPDNLLKLGLSMARLGQTDGACTALSRLATEYPSANDTIQRRAQTERGRLQCS